MSSVTIKVGKKTYRPCVSKYPCTKRGCGLFKSGLCDSDAEIMRMPCEPIYNVLAKCGLALQGNVTFKEVK